MSLGSYQRAASSNNSSTSNGNGCDAPPAVTTSGSVRLAGDNTKDRMYEPKHHQKAVRVLTVVAYIFFVSLAAITLSLYYLFIYNPPAPHPSDLSSQLYGAGANGNAYSSPIIINITDCKQVVAVAIVNRTMPTPALETPRVLSIRAQQPMESPSAEEPATTEMSRPQNKTVISDSDDDSNSTKFVKYASDYSRTVNNNNDIDYYT